MLYELPDSTKPWRSQAEMLDALQARNQRGEKRYDVDSAYRASCEAKMGLGYENENEGPAIRTDQGSMLAVAGSPTVETRGRQQINFEEKDAAESQERIRLQSEINDAETALARLEPFAAVEDAKEALRISTESIKKGGAPQPFKSADELTRAMGDERYRRDADFRAGVEARAALGVPGITTTLSDGGSQGYQA